MTDWRLAVDIGGTFTDVVLLDARQRHGGRRQDADHARPTRSTACGAASTQLLGQGRACDPADITGADRARHDADHQRADRGQDRAGRPGHHRRLRRHAADPRRAPLRHVRPADRVPGAADPARAARSRSTSAPAPRAPCSPRPAAPTLDRAGRRARRAPRSRRSASACSTPTSTPPTSALVADHLRARARRAGVHLGEVSPQIREYPRMVTTACNAATMPVIGPYLDELQKWLSAEGFGGSVLMMLSNGGVVVGRRRRPHPDPPGRVAARRPARWPARGSPGAWARTGCCASTWAARPPSRASSSTPSPSSTNDVRGRRASTASRRARASRCSVPSVDLVEIGAGGGSRSPASTDFGLLKVGPESAGAEPGPASYGRGGTEPAVTDADVVLGLLDPASSSAATCRSTPPLAGGGRRSVGDRARPRRRRHGRPASTSSSTRTWRPPPACTPSSGASTCAASPLIAFGGAGPVHACGVAELLESDRVVFPVNASVLSAFGTLVIAGAHRPRPLDAAPTSTPSTPPSATRCSTSCAPRAAGCCPPPASPDDGDPVPLRARRPLHGAGQRGHGLARRGRSWPADDAERAGRVRGRVPPDLRADDPRRRRRGRDVAAVGRGRRRAGRAGRAPRRRRRPEPHAHAGRSCSGAARRRSTRRCTTRIDLGAGATFDGPAIVEERETTAVIRPGWTSRSRPTAPSIATRSVAAHRPTHGSKRAVERRRRSTRSSSRSCWQQPDRDGQRAGQGAAAGGVQPDRARGRRPRQRRVRPARPDGRPGRHRHARPHQLAGHGGRSTSSTSTRSTRSSPATC